MDDQHAKKQLLRSLLENEVKASAVDEVAKLTKSNNHSEAMAKAAEAVRDSKLADAFRGIGALQMLLANSSFGNDLITIRYHLYTKRLKPQLEKKAPELLQVL